MPDTGLTVTTALLPDPGQARSQVAVPLGTSVAEAVAIALPVMSQADRAQLRVTLVTDSGASVVPASMWATTRPRPGVRLLLRIVPAGGAVRSVLLAVVSIAAAAFAPVVAGYFGFGALGTALIGAGLGIVGSLLVNALIPPPSPPDPGERRSVYQLSGWRNEARPGAPVPCAFGRHRYAPPFAATTYTEIVGDLQYVRALFCFGYGPVRLSELRIGDTPIEEFDEVELVVREGYPADGPVSAIYPEQVIEEQLGVELVRPLPRDDLGNIIDGPPTDAPSVRLTAQGSERVSLIFVFPSGLFRVDGDGDVRSLDVRVLIQQRRSSDEPWQRVTSLLFRSKKRETFFRQYSWALPERGRWQIQVTRQTVERTSTQTSDRILWSAIQSIRPEYPIATSIPLALVAVRVKATYQLSGQLDDLNGLVERVVEDWDGQAWITGTSRNPASAFLAALKGPSNPYPVTDAEIDKEALADWHTFCTAKELRYDRVHDGDESLGEMLRSICAAGRAFPRHDGVRWTVVVDRPDMPVIDHVSDRNSRDFAWSSPYIDPPDAMRVQFFDETNDYALSERVIPWPGHAGSIDLTEDLVLPGKTHPDEVWREARRRMYEVIHRPEAFTVMQDGAARVATRGDLLMASFNVLDRTLCARRVRSVVGHLVEFDAPVAVDPSLSYGLRYRVDLSEDDPIGRSKVSEVVNLDPDGRAVQLAAGSQMPEPGDTVHLGPLGKDSIAVKVRAVEAAEDFASRLTLTAAAPIIDELTDAEVPEDWSGQVGQAVPFDPALPGAPLITSIDSSGSYVFDRDLDDYRPLPGTLDILMQPRSEDGSKVASFRVRHRASGGLTFTTVTVPAAAGGVSIEDYLTGETIEFALAAVTGAGAVGPETALFSHVIGEDNAALPPAIDPQTVNAVGGLGHARLTIARDASNSDPLVLYRTVSGAGFETAAQSTGGDYDVAAGTTVTIIDGDATRATQANAGDFSSAAPWTADPGWEIVGGRAVHTPGTAGALSQAQAITADSVYRVSIVITGRTAGQIVVRLAGGSGQASDPLPTDGQHLLSLTATSGDDTLVIDADADFDGEVDDLVIYRQTAACVPPGDWDYYLSVRNADDVVGPAAGPFTVTII